MSIRRLIGPFAIIIALLAAAAAHAQAQSAPVKNVVLVHGAWADGSGWQPVHKILKAKGYRVTIAQIPLTSLKDDVAGQARGRHDRRG